jgi:putative ABC transport system permease protein
MLTLIQDVRYCLRTLRKSPGFTAVVIATLALGIGANTAIFSIVDAVLLRPLPFPKPERLVRLVDNFPGAGLRDVGMSVPELWDLEERSGVFDDVSAVWPIDANVTGTGHPERIEQLAVSPNYFSLLGVQAQVGRVFGPEDKAQGFAETAILSDGLWRRSFGGDPHVLGQRVRVDGDAYTIVGVMPPGFRHPGRTVATDVDMWATAGFAAAPFPSPPPRSAIFLPGAIARLKPDLTVAQAQQRLDGFTAFLRAQFPQDYRPEAHWSIQLEPLKESLTGNVRPMLLTLLGAVAMMLLIGCVNIANLLLVRASGRRREIAIRQSLGAARGRLVRQFLTESLLLSLAAGAVGVAGAASSLGLLLYLFPSKLPRTAEIAIDFRVLLFAIAVTLITGVLFGVAPAVQASDGALSAHLKESGRGTGGSRRQNRVSGVLVAAEFALCLMLMTGAGLLVRSFWKLTHVDPGFNPQNTTVARIWLPQPNDPTQDPYATPQARAAFIREVLRRVNTLPGVTSAAMSSSVPLSKASPNPAAVTVEGRAVRAADATLAEIVVVSPDYFKALGAPLLAGRFFDESDRRDSQPVAIVDRATARRYWPGESPIGKRLKLGRAQSSNPMATIVGVAGDVRHDGIENDGVPHVYFPIYQRSGKALGLIVRSGRDAPGLGEQLGEQLKRQIQAVDPDLPVFGIGTLGAMLSASLAPHRFSAQLMGAFAGLALLLAAIGIYGVLAYFVGQRAREIGVRMALGAAGSEVVRMVLWQGLKPISVGTAIGVAGSLIFGGLLEKMLYGVSAADPLVLICVPLVLLSAALLASYIPAHRATRIDPIVALRCD